MCEEYETLPIAYSYYSRKSCAILLFIENTEVVKYFHKDQDIQ